MLLVPGACTAGRGAPPSTPGSPSGRCSLGKPAAGRAARVPLDHVSSFMGPRGTFLIISPCNLINLRSVTNLEISIKNIITNQDRIQNSQGALDSFTVAGGLGSNQDLWALCGQSLYFGHVSTAFHTSARLSPHPAKPKGAASCHQRGRYSLNFLQDSAFGRKTQASKINPKRERHQKITKTYQHRSLPVSPLGQSLSALKHSSAYFPAIKALGGEICVSSLSYTGCLGVAELFCLAANESSHRRQFSALAMSVQPDPKRTSLLCPEKSLCRGAGCSSRAACTLLLQAARGRGGLLHVCSASREPSVSNSMPLSI